MTESLHNTEKWPTPQSFGVGLFTDFRLYWEALEIASLMSIFSINDIVEQLPHRVKGLLYVEGFKRRAYQDLIRELLQYNFIEKVSSVSYRITEEGSSILHLYKNNSSKALVWLLDKMQSVFVTPAWLINRLWELNPQGQGQIVIPTPIKDWKSKPRLWNDHLWTQELESISKETYTRINTVLPHSFPIAIEKWVKELKTEYERAGTLKPRRPLSTEDIKKVYYNPRARLSMAMKNVAVRMLFSRLNPLTNEFDFSNVRAQLTHRSFSVWCPRLEEFGLLMYTDYKPEIPGRLVFPTSVFKKHGQHIGYECLETLKNAQGETLYVYTPLWSTFKSQFVLTLRDTYDYFYNIQRIIYISLQDIRDEVCRVLRINTKLFDLFLKETYEDSLKKRLSMSISLETDLRQDMKVQLNRRGVYINGILYTLIAIKPF